MKKTKKEIKIKVDGEVKIFKSEKLMKIYVKEFKIKNMEVA